MHKYDPRILQYLISLWNLIVFINSHLSLVWVSGFDAVWPRDSSSKASSVCKHCIIWNNMASHFNAFVILTIFSTPFTFGQDCGFRQFSLGNCEYNLDSLIDQFDLPPDPNIYDLCQELCVNENECNYFVFNFQTGLCSLYHYFDDVDRWPFF